MSARSIRSPVACCPYASARPPNSPPAAFGADKSYDAEILLGVTTTTGDTEGEVTCAPECRGYWRARWTAVLRRFTGTIEQTPPMYSALKRDGKPLYAYARAGLTLAIAPRAITIHSITLHRHAAERLQISVRCSKGTYIRVLAEDIGRALGCGATLAGLRRTTVGAFDREGRGNAGASRGAAGGATAGVSAAGRLPVVLACPNCCSSPIWLGAWLTGSVARSKVRGVPAASGSTT